MAITILGNSGDDKGSQLEKLTSSLLARIGYQRIITNEVGPGGEEIDVAAEFLASTLMGSEALRVICECKAHKNVATMPDWLKFLGKVLVEEARYGQLIYGCFIALSGVNGNVAGNYEDLKKVRTNIKLVTGDQLTELVSSIYPMLSLEQINQNIRHYTKRVSQRIEVAYYNETLYWIVIFDNDGYTLLKGDGGLLEASQVDILRPLVEMSFPANHYFDLREEAEAHERVNQIKKLIIGHLMVEGGTVTLAKLQAGIISNTDAELRGAIDTLIGQKWIIYNEVSGVLSFPDEHSEGFYQHLTEIYLFLYSGKVMEHTVKGVIGCPYYDTHIDDELVKEVQRLQGNLPLSPADVEEAIKLLRLTPSGLVYALQPDPMLLGHRDNPEVCDERTNTFDRNYFFRTLYRNLGSDFRVHVLNRYFFEVRGLREFEIDTKIFVKSQMAKVLETNIHERVGVGELVDELGGGHITVLMYEDAPEPWEHPALSQGPSALNISAT